MTRLLFAGVLFSLLVPNVDAMAIAVRPPGRVNSLDRAIPNVSLRAGEDMKLLYHDAQSRLPLGKPIAFESPLFRGEILFRLQSADSSDPNSHDEYFSGRKNRLMQSVLQGQFLKPNIKMSDLYVGSVFTQPFVKKPPAMVAKIMEKALRQAQPGAIVDLRSDQPKTLAIYAGTAQSMSIVSNDNEDDLPDLLARDIPEQVSGHLPFKSAEQRVQRLGHPKHASQYEFDTDHIYTLHSFNEFLDFGTGTLRVPLYGRYDFRPSVGPQPLMVSAVTGEGETLYSLEVHHEEEEQEQYMYYYPV